MVNSAVAQETVFALRRKIARIEGTLPERLDVPETSSAGEAGTVLRRNGVPGSGVRLLETGARRFDDALDGGLPYAALTEIHGAETRDAGAAAGWALALAGLGLKSEAVPSPILWIGTTDIFREAGQPYAPGLLGRFGISPESIFISEIGKLEEALWVAEEAAGLKHLSAVILEIRGNPKKLDFTATRRLHRRTQAAGRPLYLVRQAASPQPTAAPVRLVVSPARAASRMTVSGPLVGSIGPPAFTVAIAKNRMALPAEFTLEWNSDERAFHERRSDGRCAKNPGLMVSIPAGRTDSQAASGAILAFKKTG